MFAPRLKATSIDLSLESYSKRKQRNRSVAKGYNGKNIKDLLTFEGKKIHEEGQTECALKGGNCPLQVSTDDQSQVQFVIQTNISFGCFSTMASIVPP